MKNTTKYLNKKLPNQISLLELPAQKRSGDSIFRHMRILVKC